MKVTIVLDDGWVSVDGIGFGGLDLSSLGVGIHAVQWQGDRGDVERKDATTGRMTENEEITSLDQFQSALDAWAMAKADADTKYAASLAASMLLPAPSSGALLVSVL